MSVNADVLSKERKRKRTVVFIILISSLAGCLYGLDLGAIGGALHFITEEMNLTAGQQGMIVGAVLGGGSIAILITGILADIFGRKKMIVISGLIFSIGVVLTSFAYDYNTILIGRLVMGTGVGISSILIPLYLSESAPSHIRGRAVTCFQLFLTGGILLAYVIDLAFVKTGNWRAMFGVLVIPGILFFIGSLFIPESPSWFFMKGMLDKSKKTLLKFNSEDETEKILEEMTLLNNERSHHNDSLLSKKYIIPFIIGLTVACLTQATGVNSILQYAPTILSEAGEKSQAIAIALGSGVTLINFMLTILAMVLIDKLGRKPLLVFSTAGATLFLLVLGAGSLLPNSTLKIFLLTVGMFGFIFSYSIGIGVVVWLAMSELLPARIRSKGLAICLFANSMISTVLAAVFPELKLIIGYSGVFFMLAAFTLVYFIVALLLVPETKGKTIEEIELYFRKKYD
jgi:MFS transporter, SP family, galactose:H+ symporter